MDPSSEFVQLHRYMSIIHVMSSIDPQATKCDCISLRYLNTSYNCYFPLYTKVICWVKRHNNCLPRQFHDLPAVLWRRWDLLWTLKVSCAALMVAVGLCSRCLHSLLHVWKGDICQMFMWLTHDKRDTIEQQTGTIKSPEVIYATNSMQFKQVIDTKLHRANCQEPGRKIQGSFSEWKCWNAGDTQDSMNC